MGLFRPVARQLYFTLLYKSGSLITAVRELARYKLDLLGVQKVKWDNGGTAKAGDNTFSYGEGNENHQLGTRFSVHQRIVPVSDRVPSIQC
jgi:hypothetical protein